MNGSKRKVFVWVCLPSLLLLGCVVIWHAKSADPFLRVTFLYAKEDTSGRQGYIQGTFQIENHSKKRVIVGSPVGGMREGILEKQKGDRWVLAKPATFVEASTRGSRMDASNLPPGATNTFMCLIPTNGGPYRLAVTCFPETGTRVRYLRGRLGLLMFYLAPPRGLGPKSMSLRVSKALRRVEGVVWPVSQPFQASLLEDVLRQTSASLVITNAAGNNSPIGFHP